MADCFIIFCWHKRLVLLRYPCHPHKFFLPLPSTSLFLCNRLSLFKYFWTLFFVSSIIKCTYQILPWTIPDKIDFPSACLSSMAFSMEYPNIILINLKDYKSSFSCVTDNKIHKNHPIQLIIRASTEDMITIIQIDFLARGMIYWIKEQDVFVKHKCPR